MTTSLRRCFDHDQNIMITIILLAFSLIGLIGLIIGNRFILVIFAACMTLILIASITIYAIGTSEQDSMQPKVPYYTNLTLSHNQEEKRVGGKVGEVYKLKSFVNKLLNRNQPQEVLKEGNKRMRTNRTRSGSTSMGQGSSRRSMIKKSRVNQSIDRVPILIPALIDDYSDESHGNVQLQLLQAPDLPVARLPTSLKENPDPESMVEPIKSIDPETSARQTDKSADRDQDPDQFSEPIRSEQWIAYERYLYQKYLNIVSQSIDLVLHIILASWMALLLDEDSDQCFGTAKPSNRQPYADAQSSAKETPVYNYNGVRYSIRPDTNESPARVTVG